MDELAAMGVEDTDVVFTGVSFEFPRLHERYTKEWELKPFREIDAGDGAALPSGTTITEAKKKRERLRATGTPNATNAGDEFISLSLSKRSDVQTEEYAGPHPESRLQREDDDLGDGEDGESYSSH